MLRNVTLRYITLLLLGLFAGKHGIQKIGRNFTIKSTYKQSTP
jgi:hypothetical protein